MWLKALRTTPRISRQEWEGLDIVSRWLVATRAAALIMSIISAAIGLVMAHGTNNLLNDFVDYRRGVDRGNYFRDQYGPQTLETGFLSVRRLMAYAIFTGLVALACGVALALTSGWLTWVLIAGGAFFLLFYTWPLKYIALGEVSLLVVWGPLMIGGTFFVLAGYWSWLAVLAGLPCALGQHRGALDGVGDDRSSVPHPAPPVRVTHLFLQDCSPDVPRAQTTGEARELPRECMAAVVRRFDVLFHPAVRHVVLDRVDRGYSPAPAQALASAIEIPSGGDPEAAPA